MANQCNDSKSSLSGGWRIKIKSERRRVKDGYRGKKWVSKTSEEGKKVFLLKMIGVENLVRGDVEGRRESGHFSGIETLSTNNPSAKKYY